MSGLGSVLDRPAWEHLAECRDMTAEEADEFFEPRTSAPGACVACPVREQCLQRGKETFSEGWWGGEYLAYVSEAPALEDSTLTPAQQKVRDGLLRFREEEGKRSATWMRLWAAGMADAAIAAEASVPRQRVQQWRQNLGLQSNVQRSTEGGYVNRQGKPVCQKGHPKTPENRVWRNGRDSCGLCTESGRCLTRHTTTTTISVNTEGGESQ